MKELKMAQKAGCFPEIRVGNIVGSGENTGYHTTKFELGLH